MFKYDGPDDEKIREEFESTFVDEQGHVVAPGDTTAATTLLDYRLKNLKRTGGRWELLYVAATLDVLDQLCGLPPKIVQAFIELATAINQASDWRGVFSVRNDGGAYEIVRHKTDDELKREIVLREESSRRIAARSAYEAGIKAEEAAAKVKTTEEIAQLLKPSESSEI